MAHSADERVGHAGPWLGIVTVLLTLVGWCSVPLFITHFAASIDVWTSNGWRYGFSALLWLPVILWGWWRRSLPAGLWRASVVPLVFNASGQVAFAWSFYNVDPATATFGLRLQIVFVAAGAYLLFPQERAMLRRPLAWLGIAMVLGGIMGTIYAGYGLPKSKELFGVGLSVAAGLLFAGYGLSVRKYMHGYHPVIAFSAISQYTAGVMVVLMLVLGRNLFGETGGAGSGGMVRWADAAWDGGLSALRLGAGQFALLLLSAVIGIALGHLFYYVSIARLGVAVSSGVIQLQPFGVAIGSWLVFAKPLAPAQWATGMIAVTGAILMLYVQWRVTSRARAAARQAAAEAPAERHPTVEVAGASELTMESGDLDAVPLVEAEHTADNGLNPAPAATAADAARPESGRA